MKTDQSSVIEKISEMDSKILNNKINESGELNDNETKPMNFQTAFSKLFLKLLKYQ